MDALVASCRSVSYVSCFLLCMYLQHTYDAFTAISMFFQLPWSRGSSVCSLLTSAMFLLTDRLDLLKMKKDEKDVHAHLAAPSMLHIW